ncbi:MAG: nucleotide exchange factor GrpE [Clostridia bacterium]|nr:nucleotide exchange factor GrpE [Clostridia bacterium]MDD6041744.1 nucleotide exchange factor GrpE [Clostridia bacterium]
MSKKSRMKKRMETKVENKPVTDEQTEAVEQTEMPVETQQAEVTEETEAVVSAAELAAALAKQEEYLNMAQRVQADFENFRRRNQNVRKEAFDDGARAFATALLPVLDNLERATAAAQNSADESLKSGVDMVLRQLCEAFEKRGITAINRKGEKFDPNLENAVMQGMPEDGEPGTVCEVFQKGYQMEGVILRHAMVKVVPE